MIESICLFLTLICFGYVALLDYKYREVENWVWLVFGCFGLGIQLNLICFTDLPLPFWSIVASAVLALSLWYFGAFGGADAKAIITLSLLMPLGFDGFTPYFPLVCLAFGVLLANFPVAYTLLKRGSLKKLEIPLLVYLFAGILLSLFVGKWFIELIL